VRVRAARDLCAYGMPPVLPQHSPPMRPCVKKSLLFLSFAVQASDRVSKGQALAIMEAMKMERSLTAPYDGVGQELLYATGDQVTEGAALLQLQTA